MAERYIPEHRRTQFKARNQFRPEELRRRREEQQVEIRKQKREENLSKRRGIQTSDGGIGVGGAATESDDEASAIESEVGAIFSSGFGCCFLFYSLLFSFYSIFHISFRGFLLCLSQFDIPPAMSISPPSYAFPLHVQLFPAIEARDQPGKCHRFKLIVHAYNGCCN